MPVSDRLSRPAALVAALLLATVAAHGQQPAAAGSWSAVDSALGRTGMAQPGGIMRYGFPRSDLQVTADGV